MDIKRSKRWIFKGRTIDSQVDTISSC